MSIIKAYTITNKDMVETNYEEIGGEFRVVMNGAINSKDAGDKYDLLRVLYTIYSIYGVKYLMEVSDNLYEHPKNKETMTYMNSFLVELTYACDLKYHDKDMTFSIVDKMVQKALDLASDKELPLEDIKGELFRYCDEVFTQIKDSFAHSEDDL